MMIFTTLQQGFRGNFIPALKKRGLSQPFRRKIDLSFHHKNYEVKTIETRQEFQEILALRREVFLKEFSGKRFVLGSDRDLYDTFADYLVVKDTTINKIIGCYRVITSLHSPFFYSSSEFHLEEFLKTPDVKLELSRACIHKDYRNGTVISLLWKGITGIMQKINARYLFGCASIQTTCPAKSRRVYERFVEQGLASSHLNFPVRSSYRFETPARPSKSSNDNIDTEIPTLVKSYLKAGAMICSTGAIDRKFRCVDYLMILDTQNIAPAYRTRYVKETQPLAI